MSHAALDSCRAKKSHRGVQDELHNSYPVVHKDIPVNPTCSSRERIFCVVMGNVEPRSARHKLTKREPDSKMQAACKSPAVIMDVYNALFHASVSEHSMMRELVL